MKPLYNCEQNNRIFFVEYEAKHDFPEASESMNMEDAIQSFGSVGRGEREHEKEGKTAEHSLIIKS